MSGSKDKTIKIWDLEGKKCIRTMRGHSKQIEDICTRGNLVTTNYTTIDRLYVHFLEFLIKIFDIMSKCSKRLIFGNIAVHFNIRFKLSKIMVLGQNFENVDIISKSSKIFVNVSTIMFLIITSFLSMN